jgi:hypothetical protein
LTFIPPLLAIDNTRRRQLGEKEVKGLSETAIKEVFRGPPDTSVRLGFVRRPGVILCVACVACVHFR